MPLGLLIPLLFIVFGTTIWAFVCSLISLISGWWRISKKMPFDNNLTGLLKEEFSFCNLNLNFFGNYRNIMNINIYDNGIKLVPFVMFKILHPPIFIKWSNISSIEPFEFFFRKGIKLRVDNEVIKIYGNASAYIFSSFNYYKEKKLKKY